SRYLSRLGRRGALDVRAGQDTADDSALFPVLREERMNLRLLQLGDSALPIGGYSHSWGLEAAIERGQVRDAASLERWVRFWLRFAVGPLEGVVLAHACRAAARGDFVGVRQANDL